MSLNLRKASEYEAQSDAPTPNEYNDMVDYLHDRIDWLRENHKRSGGKIAELKLVRDELSKKDYL